MVIRVQDTKPTGGITRKRMARGVGTQNSPFQGDSLPYLVTKDGLRNYNLLIKFIH
jgi:hypothetical protein